MHKLKAQTPDPFLVTQYLKEIAKAYNVAWDAESSIAAMETSMGNGMGVSGQAFGLAAPGPVQQTYPVNYAYNGAPPPEVAASAPTSQLPPAPKASASTSVSSVPGPATQVPSSLEMPPQVHAAEAPAGNGNLPDFDELTRRFETLKKRGK